MSELDLLITITDRTTFPDFMELYRSHAMDVSLVALGHGTARSDILGLLGLDKSEKTVSFSFVTPETWRAVKTDLEDKILIDVPGTGVAFTVPMSSVGGRRELAYLTDGQNFTRGDERVLQNTANELLVVISNQGYNDVVMDAAREAGARGGTVIHAKGTGSHSAERFFGISLASEKDVIFIVTKTTKKNDIMRSIMDKAGMETEAKAIVFSLPVTDTAGLRLIDREA